jgi:hypothetical protein
MYEGLRTLDLKKIEKFQTKTESMKKQLLDPNKSKTFKLQVKTRLMYYKRRYTYDMGSMKIYFTKGIKVEHLKTISGKYYRFALVMKLVLFELLIVSA